jgi:hypothetical protein
MAKQNRGEKPAPAPNAEENFVNLMMVAAEFASSRGGIESAKQALEDAGRFIEKAGGVAQASRALDVLDSLRSKLGT